MEVMYSVNPNNGYFNKKNFVGFYGNESDLGILIDNLDEVTLSLALKKIDRNKSVDIEKIAVKKYQNYLLQNLTNNVNQIAKVVNNNKSKVDVKRLEKQLDLIVKNQKEINKKLK